jgi:hypothetical protein
MEVLTVRVEAVSARRAGPLAVAKARAEGFEPVRVLDSNLVMEGAEGLFDPRWDITLQGDRLTESELRALDGNR